MTDNTQVPLNFVIIECYKEAKACEDHMQNPELKGFKEAYDKLWHCWNILAHHFEAILDDKSFLSKLTEQKDWEAMHHVPIVGEGGKEVFEEVFECPNRKKSEVICNVGYACDACPHNEKISKEIVETMAKNNAFFFKRFIIDIDCGNTCMNHDEEGWFEEEIEKLIKARSMKPIRIEVF